MPRMSLRRRISLAFAILIFGSLLAMAVSLLLSAEERQEELIDEVVNSTLNQIEARWPITGQLVLPKNLYFYHAPIGQTPKALPFEIARFAVGNAEFYERGHEYHVGVREHAGMRLYLLYDTHDHQERLQDIYLGVMVAVLVLTALGLVMGVFFSGSILRQLSALTHAVQHNLPLDLAVLRDQEVAILATAVSDSRAQMAAVLQRERDFTAHAGHELRTPLTTIRTSAELLRELADLSEANLARVANIEAAADEMQARLTALLFLARDLRAMQIGPVNLARAINDVLAHFAAEKPHIQRRNSVPPQVQIAADPQLLSMLLDNVLGNALRYTQTGEIVICWQNGVLRISDTGLGFEDVESARLFEPFERASTMPDGFGLGLAIVQRICDAMAWQCALQSRPGVGTEMRIQIPIHDWPLTKNSQ
ncbi:HAMP domain-containing histidine kinase [Chitinibacter fontanus]|uniref:histidine kinase n=1 Tax=Chitinibacter fontanus TaxID=1737446 RepID=A0A7D5V9L4_9NEIS|nr:HAMP domain-containing sensor histidine kinase [Chitinibacter fontanus]QLI81020.1 HAMP domain-containing histidine kinase [Chitinibacter fontanus]